MHMVFAMLGSSRLLRKLRWMDPGLLEVREDESS